jgi:hypothetical protein
MSKPKGVNIMNEQKEWTVLFYFAGDNDLSEEFIWATKEMFQIGVNDKVAVVIQLDTRGIDAPARRYTLTTELNTFKIDSDGDLEEKGILTRSTDEGGDINSASPEALRSFISESIKQCAAKNYMLVMAGHGAGAFGDRLMGDDNPPDYMTIQGVNWALEETIREIGKPLDILGFDSCVMSSIETGYEVKNTVRYFIGSEGYEPSLGWPYSRVLEILKNNPEIEPDRLAREIVKVHTNYYLDYQSIGRSTDLSACDLRQSEELAAAIGNLADLLSERMYGEKGQRVSPVTDTIILAHWRAQSYKFEEFVDLWDFCDLLENGCADKEVQAASVKLKKQINQKKNADGELYDDFPNELAYVMKSSYTGGDFQHSHGVSVYFPWVKNELVLTVYGNLTFCQNTRWDKFIEAYVSLTKRAPRPGKGNERRSPNDASMLNLNLIDVQLVSPFNKLVSPINKLVSPINKLVSPINKLISPLGGFQYFPQVKNPPTTYYQAPDDEE